MATFAFVFLPPWLAFKWAPSWWRALVGSLALALLGYLAGFSTAILLNQPFGPSAVASLVAICAGAAILSPLWTRRQPPCRRVEEANGEAVRG